VLILAKLLCETAQRKLKSRIVSETKVSQVYNFNSCFGRDNDWMFN